MSENALGFCYKSESSTTFSNPQFMAKFLNSSNFFHEFQIDFRIARSDYTDYTIYM